MIRLVFADLTSTKAVWGGLLAIAVVFGYLGSWAVSIESTASQFDNLKNLGTVVVLFSSIAGFVEGENLCTVADCWSQPSDNSIDCVDATVRDCYCWSSWWIGVRSVILPPVVSIGF